MDGNYIFGENEKLSKRLQSAKVVKLYERFKFQCWEASENGYVVLAGPSMYCQSKYLQYIPMLILSELFQSLKVLTKPIGTYVLTIIVMCKISDAVKQQYVCKYV